MDKDFDLVYRRLFLERDVNHHVFVFFSGAQQIGTSWCALSLAHALNQSHKKVLLVDCNGNFSNISSYIQLHNPLYLEDYVLGKKTLNQLVTAYKNKDFNILTAQQGNNYFNELSIGRIRIFMDDLNILSENYDYTIIDLGSDLTLKNLELCRFADDLFLMCSEQSADLIKTFEFIRFMHKNHVSANCNLIINRVNSFEDGYKIYKELCKAVDQSELSVPELFGIVRFDTRIRDTIRNKELLVSRYPSSEAAVDIFNLAKKIISENDYE